MSSRYDDELWERVPEEPGPPPPQLRDFVRALDGAPRALDLGCGDGRLALALDADVLTVADVSEVALDRARRRLPGARGALLLPDAPLPFADNAFELVLCAETLEHVRDVQLLLSEVRRVLVPGGRLALTTPAHGRKTALRLLLAGWERGFDPRSPHLRFLTARSLSGLLDEMGFEVLSLRTAQATLLAVARR